MVCATDAISIKDIGEFIPDDEIGALRILIACRRFISSAVAGRCGSGTQDKVRNITTKGVSVFQQESTFLMARPPEVVGIRKGDGVIASIPDYGITIKGVLGVFAALSLADNEHIAYFLNFRIGACERIPARTTVKCETSLKFALVGCGKRILIAVRVIDTAVVAWHKPKLAWIRHCRPAGRNRNGIRITEDTVRETIPTDIDSNKICNGQAHIVYSVGGAADEDIQRAVCYNAVSASASNKRIFSGRSPRSIINVVIQPVAHTELADACQCQLINELSLVNMCVAKNEVIHTRHNKIVLTAIERGSDPGFRGDRRLVAVFYHPVKLVADGVAAVFDDESVRALASD